MKKTVLLVLTVLFAFSLAATAFAHSGGTDSKGGHTNHSTGEYHYHHGYSAHQHEDLDGDGDLDCPYDFKDRTGQSSGSSSSKSFSKTFSEQKTYDDGYLEGYDAGRYVGYNTAYDEGSSEGYDKGYNKGYLDAKNKYRPKAMYYVVAILAALLLVLARSSHNKTQTIQSQKWQFEKDLESRSQSAKDEIEALRKASAEQIRLKEQSIKNEMCGLHKDLVEKYGADYLYGISGAPDEDFIDENLMPHSKETQINILNVKTDKYEFYLSGIYSSGKFHTRTCRHANVFCPVNAYAIKSSKRLTPCLVCKPKLPDTEWVDKYLEHHKFISQYVEDV